MATENVTDERGCGSLVGGNSSGGGSPELGWYETPGLGGAEDSALLPGRGLTSYTRNCDCWPAFCSRFREPWVL